MENRTRACDNPASSNGGIDCMGDTEESVNCSTQGCPGKKLLYPFFHVVRIKNYPPEQNHSINETQNISFVVSRLLKQCLDASKCSVHIGVSQTLRMTNLEEDVVVKVIAMHVFEEHNALAT